MTIRVMITDDHPVILGALERLFERSRDCEIVGTCNDGRECLRLVRARRPDVLVLDLSMPNVSGLTVLEQLRGEPHAPRVVLWTAGFDQDEVLRAVRLGANAVVLKQSPAEELVEIVRRVHTDGGAVDEESVVRAVQQLASENEGERRPAKLTERQVEIARLASRGLSNKEIASLLNIGVETVKTHLRHAFEKLGVSNRVELGNAAKKKGIF
ncbi:MAG: response regulator transcription factor [Thermoanaerobaculia bacterium]|nr:response regulator transcription factor [Thermoanaerobaculia bacterium]